MPLIIRPPRRPSTTVEPSAISPSSTPASHAGREDSPEAPPASPLTPVLGAARDTRELEVQRRLSTQQSRPGSEPYTTNASHHGEGHLPLAELIDMPASVSFSGDDSTDAIALRAAISSLQFQRVRAQNDLRTLEEIKRQAVERPQAFTQHLLTGQATKSKWVPPSYSDSGDSDDEADILDASAGAENTESSEAPYEAPTGYESYARVEQNTRSPAFPPIPEAQNVVRCPPIEWAKYHVIGESLDKLHREQQLRPGVGGVEERESIIAGPLNPFADRLTRKQPFTNDNMPEGRKDSAAGPIEPTTQRGSSKAVTASD